MHLRDIIEFLQTEGVQVALVGSDETEITQVAGLDSAESHQISFLNDKKYLSCLETTQAGAVILSPAQSDSYRATKLIVENPYHVYALVAQCLNPVEYIPQIHQNTTIESSAQIADGVTIMAQAVVQEGASIGRGTVIGSGAVIEENVQIGDHCRIGSNVVISHDCVIGDHVLIEAGAVIGGDGFGWANNQGQWVKIPQVGRVIIGDHVSIGNNSCIDRGAIDDTIIEDNCIIDNLVQIAHNVKIGQGSAIASQVGFAGSTLLGSGCTVAGQVGFSGHLSVTDNCHFLGKAGVTHSIAKPGAYAGFPATPASEWQKNSVRARNLDKMVKQIKQLQKQIEALTDQASD